MSEALSWDYTTGKRRFGCLRIFEADFPDSAPLLGPSLGPLIGGALTHGFNWRATFYFLAIFTGLCAISFIFFKDTFRRERSLVYQLVLRRIKEERAAARRSETSSLSHVTVVEPERAHEKWLPRPEKPLPKSEPDIGQPRVTFQDVESGPHDDDTDVKEIKLSLKDVNPVPPLIAVLRRMNNLVILIASGVSFYARVRY